MDFFFSEQKSAAHTEQIAAPAPPERAAPERQRSPVLCLIGRRKDIYCARRSEGGND